MNSNSPLQTHQLANSPSHQLQVILFDGVCNFCSASVSFIIARDPGGRFTFASLQSAAASRLLRGRLTIASTPESLVLLQDDEIYTRSSAALRIARGLRFPWNLAYGLIVVPPVLRDWLYDLVARNRYRWFGRREECMVPTPALRARFLSE